MTPVSSITNQTSTGESTYILTYRDGIQSLPVFGFIKFDSTVAMRSVVEKCQLYCRRHHFRYVSVRPFFINVLEEDQNPEEVKIPQVSIGEGEGPREDGSVFNNNNSNSSNNNRRANQADLKTVESRN